MNEKNEKNEKFESIEKLIKAYYQLVEKHKDGLPPYATFKTYLVDDEDCTPFICINRPTKIKELVNQLDDKEQYLRH